MALDVKITGLTAITQGVLETGDLLVAVDINDFLMAASGSTRKVTIDQVKAFMQLNLTFSTPNATHTGEMLGSGALTADPSIISNRDTVSAASGDFILITDADDFGLLKKVNASDFIGGDTIYSANSTISSDRTLATAGDSDTLTFDVSAGTVGIGVAVASIAAKLHIGGNVQIDGTLLVKQSGGFPVNLYRTSAAGSNRIEFSANNSNALEYLYARAGSQIVDATAASEDSAFIIDVSKQGVLNTSFKFLPDGLVEFPTSVNGGVHRSSNGDGTGMRFNWNFLNSASAKVDYAGIVGRIVDDTAATEDGAMEFSVKKAGGAFTASNHEMKLTTTGLAIGTSLVPTEKLSLGGRAFIENSSDPSTPIGGGILYTVAGALKYIGSSGTITTLGVA